MSGSWASAFRTSTYANLCFFTRFFLTASQANISGINEVLKEMTHADPGVRPGANEALEQLARVVNALPPATLLIHPEILPRKS
jgi:hypothetical protein